MWGTPRSMIPTPPAGGGGATAAGSSGRSPGKDASAILDRQHLSLSLLRPRWIEKLGIRVEGDGMGVLCSLDPSLSLARSGPAELGPSTIWAGSMQLDTIRLDGIFVSGCVGHRVSLSAQTRPYGQFFGPGRHGDTGRKMDCDSGRTHPGTISRGPLRATQFARHHQL
jgi:hypothetical protein